MNRDYRWILTAASLYEPAVKIEAELLVIKLLLLHIKLDKNKSYTKLIGLDEIYNIVLHNS